MKQKLVWHAEGRFRYLVSAPGDDPREAVLDATLEQVTDVLDQDAESANVHGLVGTHRALAALLYQHVGRETATRVLYLIAEHGGLDDLDPTDFDVTSPWHDWKLPE